MASKIFDNFNKSVSIYNKLLTKNYFNDILIRY